MMRPQSTQHAMHLTAMAVNGAVCVLAIAVGITSASALLDGTSAREIAFAVLVCYAGVVAARIWLVNKKAIKQMDSDSDA